MDSGPMGFFYNEDVFRQAGVDATKIKTWDDFYEAAEKLKEIGAYIAADSGDGSFYDAMVWLAGGQPFHTSADGKTVTIDLDEDAGTQRFTEFWQKMIDEGLVDTTSATWSDRWKSRVGTGTIASVFSGAWMPSLLLSNVPGAAGLWRADYATLNSADFLDKTTITNDRGIEIPYFGGQKFNRVLSEAAEDVSVGYQYLPFEVYARSDFKSTVGQAYEWSGSFHAYQQRQEAIEMGMKDEEGNPLEPLEKPGKKVSLSDGLAQWQKDLREYGLNQGFTIK